jgi:ABC-2 type transport system permease protein
MTYGFAEAARFEWAKLRTLRSTCWLTATTLAVMTGAGVAVGAGYRGHAPTATLAQIVDNSLAGAVVGQLLVGALGVVTAVGTRQATLIAIPRRGLSSSAKVVVFGAFATIVGVAGAVLAFLATQLATAGTAIPRASLADPNVLRPVLLTGVYLALIGLAGLGLGTVLLGSGAAIGTLFGLIFVPAFLGAALGSAAIPVAKFVPIIILANSVITVTQDGPALSAWSGILVIALYAALALAAGTARYLRRDA